MLCSTLITAFYHHAKTVKAVENRENKYDGDNIKMKLECWTVLTNENFHRCHRNRFTWDVAHIHLPAFKSSLNRVGDDDRVFQDKLSKEKHPC